MKERHLQMAVSPGSKDRENPNQQAKAGRNPRRPLKWLLWLLALLLAALLVDRFLIEPFWIEVTRHQIQGAVMTPLKIAHLSDIHTRGFGRRERHMLQILDAEKPDIILITGDTLGNMFGVRTVDYAACKALYQKMHAPLGVWFVRGNWENYYPMRQERTFYQEAGVTFLLNANQAARSDVWIVGLNDPSTGTVRLDQALAGIPQTAYKIALFHSPGYFDHIAGRVDLCLAGHTHGGQVRIPFIRPYWLPKGSGRFLAGWYEEKGTKMYVNRGLGTSIIPIRFLCRPEMSFLTIVPAQ